MQKSQFIVDFLSVFYSTVAGHIIDYIYVVYIGFFGGCDINIILSYFSSIYFI